MPKKEFVVEVNLGIPPIYFFDQFSIKAGEEFTDLDFQDRRASSGIVVRVANEVMKTNRQSFLKYLDDCGQSENAAPASVHVSSPSAVLFADFVGLARHGSVGEIVFHAISWKIAVDRTRQPEERKGKEIEPEAVIPSICVALLRCNIDLQKHWIAALYAKN